MSPQQSLSASPGLSNVVSLNVGGMKYTTPLQTLTKYSNSMLGSMFMGSLPSEVDHKGRYFIDADGAMFGYILGYLRKNKLLLPEHFKDFDRLLAEADFYQIQPLIDDINRLRCEQFRSRFEPESFLLIKLYIPYIGMITSVDKKDMKKQLYCKQYGVFKRIDIEKEYSKAIHKTFREYLVTEECWSLVDSNEVSYEDMNVILITKGILSSLNVTLSLPEDETCILYDDIRCHYEIWERD